MHPAPGVRPQTARYWLCAWPAPWAATARPSCTGTATPQTLQASISEAESWWPLCSGKYGSDLPVDVPSPLRESALEGGVMRQGKAAVQGDSVLGPPGSG